MSMCVLRFLCCTFFYFIIHCYLFSFLSPFSNLQKKKILSIHAASAKLREIFKVNFAVHFNTFSFHPLACPLYKFNLIDCYMFFSCSLACVDECFVLLLVMELIVSAFIHFGIFCRLCGVLWGYIWIFSKYALYIPYVHAYHTWNWPSYQNPLPVSVIQLKIIENQEMRLKHRPPMPLLLDLFRSDACRTKHFQLSQFNFQSQCVTLNNWPFVVTIFHILYYMHVFINFFMCHWSLEHVVKKVW